MAYVITPQGQTVSGILQGRAPRVGQPATVATSKGPVQGNFAGFQRSSASRQAAKPAAKAPAKPPARSAAVALPPSARGVAATTILPESGEVRFLDALITVAVAAITVVWTATRSASSALLWATFWVLLGGLMGVEGRGELRYGGLGIAGANASYLALRIAQLAKTEPAAVSAAAAQIQAAYQQRDYRRMAALSGPVLDLARLQKGT